MEIEPGTYQIFKGREPNSPSIEIISRDVDIRRKPGECTTSFTFRVAFIAYLLILPDKWNLRFFHLSGEHKTGRWGCNPPISKQRLWPVDSSSPYTSSADEMWLVAKSTVEGTVTGKGLVLRNNFDESCVALGLTIRNHPRSDLPQNSKEKSLRQPRTSRCLVKRDEPHSGRFTLRFLRGWGSKSFFSFTQFSKWCLSVGCLVLCLRMNWVFAFKGRGSWRNVGR